MENYALHPAEDLKTMRELLDVSKPKYGSRPMWRYKKDGGIVDVSHAQFVDGVYALGNAFCHMGMLNSKIAVLGETSVKWLTTHFATTCGNGIIVPIDKELPVAEAANILIDSNTKLVVYSGTYESNMQTIATLAPDVEYFVGMDRDEDAGKFLSYDLLLERGKSLPDQYSSIEVDGNKLSALLYTSGTTGTSKGVMLSQRNILAAAKGVVQLLKARKTSLACLPIHHSFEFAHGITSLIQTGTTICINDSLRYFADNLKLFQPEIIFVVPLFVDMMYRKITAAYQSSGTDLRQLIDKSNELRAQGTDKRGEFFAAVREAFGGNMKCIVSGGAPLSADLMKTYRDMGMLLLNGYGITECAPLISVNREKYYKDGSIGVVIPELKIDIREKSEDGDGEIWVKGDNVMLGYYQNEEATNRVLKDGWFNTEDIGRVDSDGFLFITGRKKNLIVLNNGKNVYPEEIEEYLLHIPYIKEVVVYAPTESGINETRLCAEIYLDEAFSAAHTAEEQRASLEEDIHQINRGLPVYKQVHDFNIRDTEFEKTTKKTIKRFKL
ncbi:MAG: AMP-dependent synthetase/ligase [Christensenellaceae bacterium]|jgi:long-chain acyl-CoA synthetase